MRRTLAVLATALVALTGCDQDRTTVTVLAASNVVDVVQQAADRAGIDVAVSGAGTPTLVAQVRANGVEGLDLLLLADEAAARSLAQDVPGVPEPSPFVSTGLALVASTSRAELVERDVDALLADASLDWVLAAPGVPLGDATEQALAGREIGGEVRSLESSALDVLGKVEAGAADLAIVYAANAQPAVARGDLVVLIEFDLRVTTFQQPLSTKGRDLARALLADPDWLRTLGFEPDA